MEEEKFSELLDIVRRLRTANSPENEINDVVESMTKYDGLTEEQLQKLYSGAMKKKIQPDLSPNMNYIDDYF